ncbi:MAG: NADH-quinone oxidoreductase subunit NuoI [Legionellales bacterium]|nr:NADH-quinone oxidoreductase subunit NuoI [Legionellales bacterium]|tara:strand:- start:367 stop:858 length:492 start_codon:yes stop_codon:yes gene_type:complete
MKIIRSIINLLLFDFLKGLAVTGRNFIKPAVTLQYPEQGTIPKSPRNRGALALREYPDTGEERCIACRLCEVTCPALAITIESQMRSDGTRRTTRFDIDTFLCIHCGLCQEACPVDSIVLTDLQNYTIKGRGDNIMDKEMLLNIGRAYESKIAQNRQDNEPYV